MANSASTDIVVTGRQPPWTSTEAMREALVRLEVPFKEVAQWTLAPPHFEKVVEKPWEPPDFWISHSELNLAGWKVRDAVGFVWNTYRGAYYTIILESAADEGEVRRFLERLQPTIEEPPADTSLGADYYLRRLIYG